MNMNEEGSIEILLIEDNPADARLTELIFKECRRSIGLSIARDGVEAMDLLHKKGKYANAPRPDFILLDINLPNKDGREVLAEIKSDPELKQIPVAILTASEAEEDILHSYWMHANCYLIKPVELDKFKEMVRSIMDFWFGIAKLPQRDEISECEPD
jgi:chemotaxis family two-component system response regulator Rcp1